MMAAGKGNTRTVEVLIAAGANVGGQNNEG
jgi:hypothetical protein